MIETKQDMIKRSNELCDKFTDEIQDAFDTVKLFYEECGKVNGMSYVHELCKIYDKLTDQVELLSKIRDRVNKHVKDVPDEDEFQRTKLHKEKDDSKEELDKMVIRHIPRLKK